ncbi:hypothetical protein G9P44_003954 [Scheffersomyces stipitis]|nr:hypothetical protein G9P44_003954 [Scheffersomyces stipitis]
MPRAIIAITSYSAPFFPDGKKTGLFLVEALEPYRIFKEAGFDVDFASETGTFGIDDNSTQPDFLNGQDLEDYNNKSSDVSIALANIKKASDITTPEDYDIFYASAGHGCLFDYPKADNLHRIAATIYAKGGVVAAVCHGPAIFDNLNDLTTGKPIIQGKTITGFTDVGETILQVDQIMKDLKLETIRETAEKLGATYKEPEGPFVDFSLIDGKIVTGVNPQSAKSTAENAIKALKA